MVVDYFDPNKKYYNPKSFVFLSMFFSFLLPGILFSINKGNSEGKKVLIKNVTMFVLLFILLILFILTFEDVFKINIEGISRNIFIALNLSIGLILSELQKKHFEKWITYGIKPNSIFPPILISLIPSISLVLILILNPLNDVIEYNYYNIKILYSKTMEVNEIKKFADLLRNEQIIDINYPIEIVIKEKERTIEYLFSIKTEFIDSPEIYEYKKVLEEIVNMSRIFKKQFYVIQVDENLQEVGSNRN